MAHDIEDVWALCKDIQTTLNDLHPIKVKCDDLLAKSDSLLARKTIKLTCPVCDGSGERVDFPGPILPDQSVPPPVTSPCSTCNGTGKKISGEVM